MLISYALWCRFKLLYQGNSLVFEVLKIRLLLVGLTFAIRGLADLLTILEKLMLGKVVNLPRLNTREQLSIAFTLALEEGFVFSAAAIGLRAHEAHKHRCEGALALVSRKPVLGEVVRDRRRVLPVELTQVLNKQTSVISVKHFL